MWDEQRRRDLCRRVLDHCGEHGIDLIYPPATDEQLGITEDQLGFPLPPFLRMLYSEVANGGPRLGSYHGLFGCVGGYPFDDSEWAEITRLIERLVSRSGWRPHPCIFEALTLHPGYIVQCEDCPDGLSA